MSYSHCVVRIAVRAPPLVYQSFGQLDCHLSLPHQCHTPLLAAPFLLYSLKVWLSDATYKWGHVVDKDSLPLGKVWVAFICVHVSRFLCPLTHCWTIKLFPILGYCNTVVTTGLQIRVHVYFIHFLWLSILNWDCCTTWSSVLLWGIFVLFL